ncbi:hypothetical protein [Halomonas sp.]|uniref:hypothetical protein n=1 Tax=Halomonas sp. TaxID=1486246 RepID=UPI00356221BA
MKTRLFLLFVTLAITTWAPTILARESVAIPVGTPGVVGTEGVLNGVDTTGDGILNVGDNQNINTNNDAGGAFRTSAGSTGEILFIGNSTVTEDTGQTGTLYRQINAGATGSTVNFNGDIYSTTFSVSGTDIVNFNGDVTAATNFANDGFINLGAGNLLTGAITTNTGNTGTLTLNGNSSVTGAIGGANGLKKINVVGGNASVTGAVQA